MIPYFLACDDISRSSLSNKNARPNRVADHGALVLNRMGIGLFATPPDRMNRCQRVDYLVDYGAA